MTSDVAVTGIDDVRVEGPRARRLARRQLAPQLLAQAKHLRTGSAVEAPDDAATTAVEGWILGQKPAR